MIAAAGACGAASGSVAILPRCKGLIPVAQPAGSGGPKGEQIPGANRVDGLVAPPTTPTTPTTTSYAQVFPVPGAHTYGDGLGASRGHRGQDIMAACGEPLVSVSWARVVFIGRHARAGNYVVLRYKKLRQDYMYAHLAGPPAVALKQRVAPGQLVGYVGDTGNASTCHLHFELWVGRWYRGGRAVNPTPHLQYWDTYS
jgi:murein DD-endopeptidase MepM/ murein hydrolase activator NlpD